VKFRPITGSNLDDSHEAHRRAQTTGAAGIPQPTVDGRTPQNNSTNARLGGAVERDRSRLNGACLELLRVRHPLLTWTVAGRQACVHAGRLLRDVFRWSRRRARFAIHPFISTVAEFAGSGEPGKHHPIMARVKVRSVRVSAVATVAIPTTSCCSRTDGTRGVLFPGLKVTSCELSASPATAIRSVTKRSDDLLELIES